MILWLGATEEEVLQNDVEYLYAVDLALQDIEIKVAYRGGSIALG